MPRTEHEDPLPNVDWGDFLIELTHEYRNLDRLDGELANLLAERCHTARRIRVQRERDDLPMTDREFDAQIIARYERLAPGSASVARAILAMKGPPPRE